MKGSNIRKTVAGIMSMALICSATNAVAFAADTAAKEGKTVLELSFEDEKEQIQLQMERDKAKANKDRLEWDNKEYKRKKRSQERVRKRQEREFEREQKRENRRARSGNNMGCFIIILFFIGLIVLYVFNYYNENPESLKTILNSQYEESSVPEQVIIKSLDEIPKVTLDRINNESIKVSSL